MNDTIAIITAIVLVFLALAFCFFLGQKTMENFTPENLYSINAEVIDRKGNEIFIRDLRDEIWSFDSDLAWEIGDEMTVIFDTVNTDTIYDDKIVSVNWLGEWEG